MSVLRVGVRVGSVGDAIGLAFVGGVGVGAFLAGVVLVLAGVIQ